MKSCRRFLIRVPSILMIFFFLAFPLLAAEGAEPDPADSTTGLIFRWLNFVIVFGGIGYLIAKNGGAFFRGNAKEIASSILQAAAAKAEAQRELHEVEGKVERLDQDVAEMRAEARRSLDAEAERLQASGRAEIEKINHAAQRGVGRIGAGGAAAGARGGRFPGGGARGCSREFQDEYGDSRKDVPVISERAWKKVRIEGAGGTVCGSAG